MSFLCQIHHQFRDGHTEMVRQFLYESEDGFDAVMAETAKTHPLPDGAMWMFCKEGSPHFVMAAEETA